MTERLLAGQKLSDLCVIRTLPLDTGVLPWTPLLKLLWPSDVVVKCVIMVLSLSGTPVEICRLVRSQPLSAVCMSVFGAGSSGPATHPTVLLTAPPLQSAFRGLCSILTCLILSMLSSVFRGCVTQMLLTQRLIFGLMFYSGLDRLTLWTQVASASDELCVVQTARPGAAFRRPERLAMPSCLSIGLASVAIEIGILSRALL